MEFITRLWTKFCSPKLAAGENISEEKEYSDVDLNDISLINHIIIVQSSASDSVREGINNEIYVLMESFH